VLEAALQALGLQKLLVSKAAMREGILYDILGRASENDLRDESVDALTLRYGIDTVQAERVQRTALDLFAQVEGSWNLDPDDARMLGWAARLHELGLMIAHSGYHVHGSYVLENSDIAGFSRQEQQLLAALVRSHRRNVSKSAFDALPERLLLPARRMTALLRLAVLLNRAHEDTPVPALELSADDSRLSLILPQAYIDARPLLRADLIGETDGMAGLGVQFRPFVA
jgi:exopolyphosphatase/guanosine-5'-triphosphate,3'-diphosphate pyrophosphatase